MDSNDAAPPKEVQEIDLMKVLVKSLKEREADAAPPIHDTPDGYCDICRPVTAPPPSDAAQLAAERLLALKENWDSYGAPIISKIAVDAALQLRNVLATTPLFVPMSDGGVQLEWHSQGFDVELEIEPNGRLCQPEDAPVAWRYRYRKPASPLDDFWSATVKLPEWLGPEGNVGWEVQPLYAHPEDAPGRLIEMGERIAELEVCNAEMERELQQDAPGGPWEVRKGFFSDDSGAVHESHWWHIHGKPGEHECHIDCLTEKQAIAVRDTLNRVDRLKGEGETDG
jgi:hypothetical protein